MNDNKKPRVPGRVDKDAKIAELKAALAAKTREVQSLMARLGGGSSSSLASTVAAQAAAIEQLEADNQVFNRQLVAHQSRETELTELLEKMGRVLSKS